MCVIRGFNHILTAQRQIGSLVKPAIYLTALENKRKYTLATRVSDGPVTVKIGPKNIGSLRTTTVAIWAW